MHEDQSNIGEIGQEQKTEGREQFPVDTDVLTKVHFDTGTAGDLLRIVAMNNEQTSECSSYQEYHYAGSSIAVADVTSFTMYGGTLDPTQTAIDSFVGSMTLCLNVAQAARWCRGVYSPSAAQKRLYSTVDPDDSTKMIGVLVEQDSRNNLVQITWYKTTNSGSIFSTTPGSLSFRLVTDQYSQPSIDPNDIGGWTWYYTTSLGSCT